MPSRSGHSIWWASYPRGSECAQDFAGPTFYHWIASIGSPAQGNTLTDRRKHDDPLAGLMARTLATGLNRSGKECPAPEILAAFFEQSLPRDESARWELHFSNCTRCQQQLAALARMETAAIPAEPQESRPSSLLWSWRWLAPLAATLGAVAIWITFNSTNPVPQTPSKTVATAENRALGETPESQAPARTDQPSTAVPKERNADAVGLADRPQESAGSGTRSPARQIPTVQGAPSSSDSTAFSKVLSPGGIVAGAPSEPSRDRVDAVLDKNRTKGDEPQAGQKLKEEEKQAEKREAQIAAFRSLEPQSTPPAAPAAAPATEADKRAESTKDQKKDEGKPALALGRPATTEEATAHRRRSNASTSMYVTVSVAGEQALWRVGPQGSIERSDDAGATWQRQTSGVAADLLAGSAPSATVCWAVGRGGVVLRTLDGVAWTQLGSPSSLDLVSVEAASAKEATVTTSEGKRYITADGGRTWRSL